MVVECIEIFKIALARWIFQLEHWYRKEKKESCKKLDAKDLKP